MDFPYPEPPDPECVARLTRTLHRLDEAHRRYRLYAAKVIGVGPTELAAIIALIDNPGMSPTDLGRELVLSSGAITAVIDRLENTGHVYRTDDPTDRRRTHLNLTDHGRQAVTAVGTAYQYLLSTTGTDTTIASALPQLDNITYVLNTAARQHHDTTTIETTRPHPHPAHAAA